MFKILYLQLTAKWDYGQHGRLQPANVQVNPNQEKNIEIELLRFHQNMEEKNV